MSGSQQDFSRRLIDNLLNDLKVLGNECRRKYPPVREASETVTAKLKTICVQKIDLSQNLESESLDIIQPFILGSDTKNAKIVHLCLGSVQRLICHNVISKPAASAIVNLLWSVMESKVEELKLLQTAILLITTSPVVQHASLAKALVLCFRLHFTKDSKDTGTNNTAAATVRQLATVVFERVVNEDFNHPEQTAKKLVTTGDDASNTEGNNQPPKSLRPCAADAYMLFQDFCFMVNAEQPVWLTNMTEMTRTLGLELIESILCGFKNVFLKHEEFGLLLKHRVCSLVIKLFSPSLKYRPGAPQPPNPSPFDKPYFAITMRLLRIVQVLITDYYSLLVTECEIFLSLLVKFLDPEKPKWQRALALEVLYKFCSSSCLIRKFCESYDMKEHSTKILQDIVNGIGCCVQSRFVSQSPSKESKMAVDTQGQPPALVGGMPVGSGVTPQPAFAYKNLWIPLVVNISAPQGSLKLTYLEMIDKIESPPVQEGYVLSLAFLCLLDVVRSIQNIVNPTEANSEITEENQNLYKELLNSTWCGVLAALSLLLDASTDESATETILKSQQVYVHLCGKLGLNTHRDAFITALCKASLPPYYALAVLQSHSTAMSKGSAAISRSPTSESTGDSLQISSQVVAVGTPMPSASVQHSQVMLTAKNIQCMRAILGVAHCHGSVLGTSWHLVLTTLQHLVWILGLKPSNRGTLKSDHPQATESTVLTTAVMADLPVLSSMLSRLFESSRYLNDVALHHLINALCELSDEAMEIAYSNKEASLFPVAKLLETGLKNMNRVEVLWRPVTQHFLEVCQHPQHGLRSYAAEALCQLVREAINQNQYRNEKCLSWIMSPLVELSSVPHSDIRTKQLECVLTILHSNDADTLYHAWPSLLCIVGALQAEQSEGLVRLAFQSLQLVVADFLSSLPCNCLKECVQVTAKFGQQNQDLNISLTAISLLWNIADHLFHNRQKIESELQTENEDQFLPPYDALWMVLFTKLEDICIDERPAVRKSAGQTLFSTISAHACSLDLSTWHHILWKVLFTLLEHVNERAEKASDEKSSKQLPNSGNILMHHSRNTAHKQWAETRVLSLSGVARVFNTQRHLLQKLEDFLRAWSLLLEHIENSALCKNTEVSLAALKSFQAILQLEGAVDSVVSDELSLLLPGTSSAGLRLAPPCDEIIPRTISSSSQHQQPDVVPQKSSVPKADTIAQVHTSPLEDKTLWSSAWKTWLMIGTSITSNQDASFIPSQAFLCALIQLFPHLYDHVKNRFASTDLSKLSDVLRRALSSPISNDTSPLLKPTDDSMSPLQESVLESLKVLLQNCECLSMSPELFDLMLKFVLYAVDSPKLASSASTSPISCAHFVAFAEQCMEQVVTLYEKTASMDGVIKKGVLEKAVMAFGRILEEKYSQVRSNTWITAITCLLDVLQVGIPVSLKHQTDFDGMWKALAPCLENFLFCSNEAPSSLTAEEHEEHEALDVRVVRLLRDEVLPHSNAVPRPFLVHAMNLLNRGSIHSATQGPFIDTESSRTLREDFAKTCFETLLQFSFISKQAAWAEGSLTKLAVSALVQRCHAVLSKYVEDERLSGKCPLPRARTSEMTSVLKAIATLLVTLKKSEVTDVDEDIWRQVIDMYPVLVDCTISTCPRVSKALRQALQEYGGLLHHPIKKL